MSGLRIIGMSNDRRSLILESTLPKEEFNKGGVHWGHQYRFNMNHFSLLIGKQSFIAQTGITEQEFNEWESMFVHRYDPLKSKWYNAMEDNEMTTRNAQDEN